MNTVQLTLKPILFALFLATQIVLTAGVSHAQVVIDTQSSTVGGDLSKTVTIIQNGATALDRFGHVDEIAAMVAFVAGPESSYITGANLTVDGGMNA